MTDIDQLHKAIENQATWSRRQTGKTTIQIHNLAGQIQVSDCKNIVIWIPQYHHMGYLRHMIKDIFDEQGIRIIRINGREWLVEYENEKKELLFVSKECADYERNFRLAGHRWLEMNLDDQNDI